MDVNLKRKLYDKVDCTTENDSLMIHVADNGNGMDSAQLEELNHSFHEPPSDKQTEEDDIFTESIGLINVNSRLQLKFGTKYGLSIVSKLEKAHAFLSICHNIRRKEIVTMHAVMIVDDEPLMLKYLNENINRIAPDWHVTGLASDGLQAVSLLQRQDFDLVITDIKMPEMDGLELAKFIYEIYPQTKVVIISGFDDFDYARRAIRCGVSDYLLKPLSDENITDTLNKISENIEESASKAFSDHILSKSEKFTDIELKSAFLNAVIQNNLAHIKSLYAVIHRRGIWQTDPFSCIMVLSADSASLLKQGYDYPKITSCKIHLNQQCVESFQNSSRATVLL